MMDAYQHFTKSLNSRLGTAAPTREQLQEVAQELLALSTTVDFDREQYPIAPPEHEQLYELYVDPLGGPSLYLVSDGVDVGFEPHDHETWAIIVGIQGREHNVLFTVTDANHRRVTRVSEQCVGPGESLILEAQDIHAIDANQGKHPTYHLHLYGRSLGSLPSFDCRRYVLDQQNPSTVVEDYWQQYWQSLPPGIVSDRSYQVDQFGDTPELADELGQLILDGTKIATCSALWEWEAEQSPPPVVGLKTIVLNSEGVPLCIIEATEVTIRPFNTVDAQFAYDEGEDDRTLESWRREHWKYFSRVLPQIGRTPTPNMPLVCERFRVVYSQPLKF